MSRNHLSAFSFLLLAAATGLAGCKDTTAEPAEPLDVQAEIQQVFVSADPWYREVLCELLLDDDPQIRVLASVGTGASWDENNAALDCPAPLGVIDPVAIRKEIAKEASDEPAILAMIYGVDCGFKAGETGCDAPRIRQQLLESDPENAYVHLLNIQTKRGENDNPAAFTDQERQHVLAAARSTRHDVYWGAGLYDSYLAIKALPDLPPCPMDNVNADDGQTIRLADSCLQMASLSLLNGAFLTGGYGYSPFRQGCMAAREQDDDEIIEACLQVADLMRDTGRTLLANSMGAGLRRSLERPQHTGANREQPDSEQWKKTVRAIEFDCAMPKGIFFFNNDLPGTMPPEHFGAHLQDLQETTEDTAYFNAAKREFAAYPDAFILDPERCADIYALDEAVQKQLADDWENLRAEDFYGAYRERVLNDLVQALNAQDSS